MGARITSSRISCRAGVFETNSSSMHSLVVLKESSGFPKACEWERRDLDDGTYAIEVGSNDFGRAPLMFLSHPVDKFIYLLADRYGRYSTDTEGRVEFIEDAVEAIDGCSSIEFCEKGWDGETDYGYVDHQSTGVVWRYLDDNCIDATEFIKDPRFAIIIDGDEYCAWDEMKESGLVDVSNIEFDLLAKEVG